ncbi:MAG: cytochrome c3 family protein [Acidobacteriota bacterium]
MQVKKVLLMTTILGLMPIAQAQVASTKHDLTTLTGDAADRVCAYCHTPHMAVGAASQDPLWNHNLSANASYGVYGSSTLDASDIGDIGVATAGTATTTHLCMSCHDGTIALGALYNPPNSGSVTTIGVIGNIGSTNADMGTSLADDHPVNFTYNTALSLADGELEDPTANATVAALLDGAGKVQCSSCHDPHDDTFAPFLVIDNAASGLCSTCHQK